MPITTHNARSAPSAPKLPPKSGLTLEKDAKKKAKKTGEEEGVLKNKNKKLRSVSHFPPIYRAELVLETTGVSVAPPQRAHLATLSFLPPPPVQGTQDDAKPTKPLLATARTAI